MDSPNQLVRVTNGKHPRHLGRVAVFQALYSGHISQENEKKILDDILGRYNFDDDIKEYVTALFLRTIENKKFIVETISKYLENWEWSRVALLDQLILQMATAELFYIDDVPPKVTIAEAIEIAQQYSTSDSSAFVNGILDAIYKEQNLMEDG
ncbi:transcription antitermination factor NusB [bacterium]|nr:transcription antitermination factor NusB [bacterium]